MPDGFEDQYLDLLDHLLTHGEPRADRTGVGTLGVFGWTLRADLDAGLPLVTTKRVPWHHAVCELFWFLSGDTNIRALVRQGVHIWTAWPLAAYRAATGSSVDRDTFEAWIRDDPAFAETWGELGPVYGKQWRRWPGPDGTPVDQIAALERGLRERPESRRHLLSAWNPGELDRMALPPCHVSYQFHVDVGGRLSCLLYQRSADTFLGLPWNLFEAALLTHLLAAATGHAPGELVWSGGDVHLYRNHVEQARTQLARTPTGRPRLQLTPRATIDAFEPEDVTVSGYDPHPGIPAPIAT